MLFIKYIGSLLQVYLLFKYYERVHELETELCFLFSEVTRPSIIQPIAVRC